MYLNKQAFTLIELLVVVLIIGILAAVALPQYTKAVEKARATEALTTIANWATAQRLYQMSTGSYATDMTVLDIEMPGTSLSTTSFQTNNFTFVMGGTTTPYLQAGRRKDSDQYWVVGKLDANGVLSRFCTTSNTDVTGGTALGTTNAAKVCKSIANGNASGTIK